MSISKFFSGNNLCVIPVHGQTKRPKPKNWQQRTAADNDPNEFAEGDNFGVVLGDASFGLVDIDLDCDLARQLAPYFLPPTGWIFGRPSAPKSHYLYRVSGDAGRGRKFDASGKFAEYRANGQMTVFPPSIHPSGETLGFTVSEQIGISTQAGLQDRLRLMAMCAIVGPFYVTGKRNDLVLALSGTLLTDGKSESDVLHLVEVLCDVTRDPEKSARLATVRNTAARWKKNEPIKQHRHLAELLGERATEDLSCYLGHRATTETVPQAMGWKGILSSDDQNDTGLAKLFAERVKDRVLFNTQEAIFYVCQDGIWTPDHHGLLVAAELDTFIQTQVAELRTNLDGVPHDQCLSLTRFLLKYRNRSNARNAIDQSRTFLASEVHELEGRDDVIAVGNGLLGLTDGELIPLKPEHHVTKYLTVTYDPSADCPNFKRVLSDAFGGDDDLIRYVQGISGYWLTPDANRQELYILHGSGANGKSTLLNAINHVLGPYAGSLMSDTIFEGSTGQHNSDLASMKDYRLAVVHEAESKFRLNAARLKQITGEDSVKVRALYKDPTVFVPKFKVVIVCNKRPNLDAYDDALKRRIKLIPFDYVVPPDKRDPKLGDKLKAEASGILNFMLAGAQMHYRGEIREPGAVREATRNYLHDQDSVSSFLKDATLTTPGATVAKGTLYDAYQNYCTDEAMPAVSKGEFGTILKTLRYLDTRSGEERQWKGLRLLLSDEGADIAPPRLKVPSPLKRVG